MYTNIEELLRDNANIITVESEPKVGKLTFTAYLINNLLDKKALLFTPQEPYLFDRRLKIFENQFAQLENIQDSLDVFYLKTDWHHLKQSHGYGFFHEELVHIIRNSTDDVIIFHRFGEFFEFQDRYEIEPIFRALVKLAEEMGKKIFFLTNTKNENFEFIKNITEEFADVIVDLKVDEQNRRQIFIKDMLTNQSFPPYLFNSKAHKFSLDRLDDMGSEALKEKKRILICDLGSENSDHLHLCQYLLNYSGQFHLHYAGSFQEILNEVFVTPDLIIILMPRNDANYETISAIKKHLKEVKIIVILDQDFIRIEDKRKAFAQGCDELFNSKYVVDELIMAFEKAIDYNFYEERLSSLDSYEKVIEAKTQMISLVDTAQKNALYFTLFKFEIVYSEDEQISSSGRLYDFVYTDAKTFYCLAVNTQHNISDRIIDNYKRKGVELKLSSYTDSLDGENLKTFFI